MASRPRMLTMILAGFLVLGVSAVSMLTATAEPPVAAPPQSETAGGVTIPVRAPGAALVRSGDASAYVLDSDGQVWIWDMPDSNVRAVRGIDAPVTALAAAPWTAYALTEAGEVWAWGLNEQGQLGNGTTGQYGSPGLVQAPTGADGPLKFKAVAANYSAGYGLAEDGSIWAWGDNNDYGVLANQSTKPALTPVRVKIPGDKADAPTVFTAICASYLSAFGLTEDGQVWGWGANTYGELGNGVAYTGVTKYSSTPVPVTMPVVDGKPVRFVDIASGWSQTFGLDADGRLWAWGNNDFGQLGDGSTTSRSTPVAVAMSATTEAGSVKFSQVAAGLWSTLALDGEGRLWAWGNNGSGSFGNGSLESSSRPIQVKAPSAPTGGPLVFRDLASSGRWGFAVADDGSVWTWGKEPASSRPQDAKYRLPQLVELPLATTADPLTEVFFGGQPGANLEHTNDGWQVTTPPGCGPVDVEVRFLVGGKPYSASHQAGHVFGEPAAISGFTSSISGLKLTAEVTATGDDAPVVQWQTSTDLINWRDLPGQTEPILHLSQLLLWRQTYVRAEVSNCWSKLDSPTPAVLSDYAETAGYAPWALGAGVVVGLLVGLVVVLVVRRKRARQA